MTWTNIPDTTITTGKPIKATTGRALRDNIPAVANRDTGAPWVQVPVYEVFTSSGTFSLPDEISAFTVICTGSGTGGTGGSDSTFTYDGTTITGESSSGTSGASASGGDINIAGQSGQSFSTGATDTSATIHGGTSYWGGSIGAGSSASVSTANSTATSLGGAGTAIKRFAVASGATSGTVSVDADGNGIVVIIY